MLEIVDFIKTHHDWELVLNGSPYGIKVSREKMFGHNLIMLKYNTYDSDFNIPLVRECRGLILDEDTLEPLSVPFFKFGNYGESYCPQLDWKTVRVTEKIDGSIIKVSYIGDNLLVSTNGSINAFKAALSGFGDGGKVNPMYPYKTYGDMFMAALGDRSKHLEKGKTYMFELTSPYNRVVVPYEELRIALIGIRDNKTLQEESIYNSPLKEFFYTPKLYAFKTLKECIQAAGELPYDEEGYVAVDESFNRVKIKSVAYVAAHHTRTNLTLTEENIIELVRKNEGGEFLTYFPEKADLFNGYLTRYNSLVNIYESLWKLFLSLEVSKGSRKDIALFLQSHKDTFDLSFIFSMIDKRINNPKEYFNKITAEQLLTIMRNKLG